MVVQARTVATAKATPSAPTNDLVNTAELVRGRVYYYKDQRFELGKPEIVSDTLADALEEEVEEVSDAEGERFGKPRFLVHRGVPRPGKTEHHDERPTVRRLPVKPLPKSRT